MFFAISTCTRSQRRHCDRHRQESLANAKVSARQCWYIGHNSLNHPSLAFFTVTSSSTKFQENLNL